MTVESVSRCTSTLKRLHTWVVAAEIVVDDSVARLADFRGSFHTKMPTAEQAAARSTVIRSRGAPLLDTYVTHNVSAVTKWLAAHPRFHLHFPPGASWLNLVERWFAFL